MSTIIYTETTEGIYKKSAYEVVSYAKSFTDDITAISFNAKNPEELFKYGAKKVLNYKVEDKLSPEVIAEIIVEESTDNIIFSHSNESLSIAPYVAIAKDIPLITNVLSTPQSLSPLEVERNSFSGKGIMTVQSKATQNILCIMPNSFGVKEQNTVQEVSVEEREIAPKQGMLTLQEKIESVEKQNLKEADIVVSAGRGMKAAENWQMIEELADVLGAATACSKPVSDMGWRPHTEHVGQTGKTIAPNLYIAVGISGAIQHLAGLNASKNIVVINNDPEAPFFKSANYGIVGDAFEVVPKLTEAIKKIK